MHGQIDLQAYLLLPVQRIPRYKLLLEDLTMCTPRSSAASDDLPDKLDLARDHITELASLMNEEKREAESRLRLFHWQQRITMRGPSPLVQPHRKLILDGELNLIRLVKKESSFVEVDTTVFFTNGEQTVMPSKAIVPIDFIVPEPMDRSMYLVLCSDILVLVSPREGAGPDGPVDLFNVLRMGTMKEPASIVQNHILRVVDNKVGLVKGGWCDVADPSPSTISVAAARFLRWSGAVPSILRDGGSTVYEFMSTSSLQSSGMRVCMH